MHECEGTERNRDECPGCGSSDIQSHPSKEARGVGMLWCPDCENEFWREGNTWWQCGHDGKVMQA